LSPILCLGRPFPATVVMMRVRASTRRCGCELYQPGRGSQPGPEPCRKRRFWRWLRAPGRRRSPQRPSLHTRRSARYGHLPVSGKSLQQETSALGARSLATGRVPEQSAQSNPRGDRFAVPCLKSSLKHGEIYHFNRGAIQREFLFLHQTDEFPAGFSLGGLSSNITRYCFAGRWVTCR
jgi:hypothetical protein